MKFESLRFALIAVVVLLAIYFGGQLVEGNDSRTYRCHACYDGHTITLPYGDIAPYPEHKSERIVYCDLACSIHAGRMRKNERAREAAERLHREKLECDRRVASTQFCSCPEDLGHCVVEDKP